MSRKPRDRARPRGSDAVRFSCQHCRQSVPARAPGTRHRNHCPHCLWSRHLDERPGDRGAACEGAMEPIAVWVRSQGEWSLVHRCVECQSVRTNRIAGDDSELVLISLAMRPVVQPPFPLERLRSLRSPSAGGRKT